MYAFAEGHRYGIRVSPHGGAYYSVALLNAEGEPVASKRIFPVP